ncbi:hypothetical protein [Microbacterium gorillae]|uniref:hypothetical protein n=1 Tax=Microbacterium gorillae TaxID=1231063 RepID=UPI00058B792B|nr:hypothetical protein [Microbacterium gorillae]
MTINADRPMTGAQAVIKNATGSHAIITTPAVTAPKPDPARRQDVLFRVRHKPGEMSVWWPISAFVLVSGSVVALLSLIPGGQ